MPLDFLGLARTRLFEGLVPQTQNTKLVRNSRETEPLLYCIKCNTVEVQKLNRTQKNLVSVWTELIVFVHCESRLHVLLTWQASMQIYWNNNSNNDNNNNKEQNKTKKSLRKELYVFLTLTVKLLYQFLPENVLFYHDLHTVNNTKKARKEKKSSWI